MTDAPTDLTPISRRELRFLQLEEHAAARDAESKRQQLQRAEASTAFSIDKEIEDFQRAQEWATSMREYRRSLQRELDAYETRRRPPSSRPRARSARPSAVRRRGSRRRASAPQSSSDDPGESEPARGGRRPEQFSHKHALNCDGRFVSAAGIRAERRRAPRSEVLPGVSVPCVCLSHDELERTRRVIEQILHFPRPGLPHKSASLVCKKTGIEGCANG